MDGMGFTWEHSAYLYVKRALNQGPRPDDAAPGGGSGS